MHTCLCLTCSCMFWHHNGDHLTGAINKGEFPTFLAAFHTKWCTSLKGHPWNIDTSVLRKLCCAPNMHINLPLKWGHLSIQDPSSGPQGVHNTTIVCYLWEDVECCHKPFRMYNTCSFKQSIAVSLPYSICWECSGKYCSRMQCFAKYIHNSALDAVEFFLYEPYQSFLEWVRSE
jgi:hypothetical protein